ncbi:hypothetical protein [Actinoplanes sp. GCM10030250]|uniref:hypothetical protein n=1 Tax=Actinoplanes sp. GCM10030250 TaxID=3273376 RepID=UPI00362183DE
MTNWMTAAGLAFIAGGLATLISFRAVIFGGGARRASRTGVSARRRRPKAITSAPPETAPPVRAIREPESAEFPSAEFDLHEPEAGAFTGGPAVPEIERSGLASIGFAADDEEEPDGVRLAYEDQEPDESGEREREDPEYDDDIGYDEPYVEARRTAGPAPAEPLPAESRPAEDPWAEGRFPQPRPVVDRSDRGYGDRVEDWVRPSYRDLDDRPPAGDYWTPVPDDLYTDPEPSARAYGWPVPVERLPPVPDYEPATGFDLTPVQAAEPTALVTAWTPDEEARRIRLPRSWSGRDERAEAGPRHGRGDRARPRPRPRPVERSEPGSGYVSRHSAGPHG